MYVTSAYGISGGGMAAQHQRRSVKNIITASAAISNQRKQWRQQQSA